MSKSMSDQKMPKEVSSEKADPPGFALKWAFLTNLLSLLIGLISLSFQNVFSFFIFPFFLVSDKNKPDYVVYYLPFFLCWVFLTALIYFLAGPKFSGNQRWRAAVTFAILYPFFNIVVYVGFGIVASIVRPLF